MMTQPGIPPLHHLIDRVARLSLADDWAGGLNPSQRAALGYLAQANRFSRAPSHVAGYLGATRGTVSQTLHVLERKGLVRKAHSATDRRAISYDVTAAGHVALGRARGLDAAIAAIPADTLQALQHGIVAVLQEMLVTNGGRSFGLCRTCRHHESTAGGARCALLDVDLAVVEAGQICQEHTA
jgi:DNA-binding MarR family transcriptional regulator